MGQHALHLVIAVLFLHLLLLGETYEIVGRLEKSDHPQKSRSLVFKHELTDSPLNEARTTDAKVIQGENLKKAGRFEKSDHPLKESRSLVFKHDLTDTSPNEARKGDARDINEIQRQSLLDPISGILSTVTRLLNSLGLGDLVGGLGNAGSGLLQPLFNLLGLSPSSREHLNKILMKECGNKCNIRTSEMKTTFRKDKDLDSDVISGMDDSSGNPVLRKVLVRTLQRKDISNDLEEKELNYKNENLSYGNMKSNIGGMARLRLKRQPDDGQSRLSLNARLQEAGEQSGSDIVAEDRIWQDTSLDKEGRQIRSPTDQELDSKDNIEIDEMVGDNEENQKMNYENDLDITDNDLSGQEIRSINKIDSLDQVKEDERNYEKTHTAEDSDENKDNYEAGLDSNIIDEKFGENSEENIGTELQNTDYKEIKSEKSNSEQSEVDDIDNNGTDNEEKIEIGSEKSVTSEEYKSDENAWYKDSGSIEDLDSDIDDKGSDVSNHELESGSNYNESGDVEDRTDDVLAGIKGSNEPEVSAEDIQNSKDVSSNEYPSYFDYQYIEYGSRRESPELSYSKETLDESDRIDSASTETARNKEKGKGYLPAYYNFRDIYRSAFERIYWPFMYKKYPQPLIFDRGLFNSPLKANRPVAEAKQFQTTNLYPRAMAFSNSLGSTARATSSLGGSYANAQSTSGLGYGAEGFGMGEGIGEDEELGIFGKK